MTFLCVCYVTADLVPSSLVWRPLSLRLPNPLCILYALLIVYPFIASVFHHHQRCRGCCLHSILILAVFFQFELFFFWLSHHQVNLCISLIVTVKHVNCHPGCIADNRDCSNSERKKSKGIVGQLLINNFLTEIAL